MNAPNGQNAGMAGSQEIVPFEVLNETHFAGARGIRQLFNAMHTLYESLNLVRANPAVRRLRLVKLERMQKEKTLHFLNVIVS